MKTEIDATILRRWVERGDADAFSEISRLYAGMVYGTCLRITGNEAEAADASQETFFQLLKQASRVTGSLGSWLHQVATRRAIDLVRRDNSRRRREETFAAAALQETDNWADIAPLVDEAIGELDEELRDILLRHHLEGQSMTEIVRAKGVSQPTVSRRVESALAGLREKLRAKGVLVPTMTLGALLSNAAQAAPQVVLEQLGKMALTASSAAGTTSEAAAIGAAPLSGVTPVARVGLRTKLAVPPVVIQFSAEAPDKAERRQADVVAMTRHLEQALEGGLSEDGGPLKPEARMLLAGSGRSVRAMYVEGLGPVFMIKVDFPLLAPQVENSVASVTNSESGKALQGSQGAETSGAEGSVSRRSPSARYREEQLEALKTTLLAALKQGTNLRDVKSDEFIVVSVFGPAAESESPRTGLSNGSVLSLRARKSDVEAFAKGELTLEAFRSRTVLHAYTGSGHGVTSVNSWLQDSRSVSK